MLGFFVYIINLLFKQKRCYMNDNKESQVQEEIYSWNVWDAEHDF
nr:MAG TPA: hypothetical protein [Bacteriophage sp.]